MTSPLCFAVMTAANSSLWVMRTLLGNPRRRHSWVSAFTLMTTNSLEDSWHVSVFAHCNSWTPLFRNPSSLDAHLPQALSPLPQSHHPPLPSWAPVVAACFRQGKASSQAWRCWPLAGSHAGTGDRFPGWRGSGRSRPPAAAWDPRPPPTEGWAWLGRWRTAGPTRRPPAPRPLCRHGYRWRAVSPKQPGGERWGQSVVRQERWSWKERWRRKDERGWSDRTVIWENALSAAALHDLNSLDIDSQAGHHSEWHFMHLRPTHLSTSETIHLTISPSLHSVHWDSSSPIISLCKIKQRGKRGIKARKGGGSCFLSPPFFFFFLCFAT